MTNPPKLKVFYTIFWGYQHAFRNMRLIFRIGWPFFLILWGCMASVAFFALAELEFPVKLAEVLFFLVCGLFAVRWHRAILMNERGSTGIKIGGRDITYLFLCITPHFFLEVVEVILPPYDDAAGLIIVAAVYLVLSLAILAWYCCFSMVLPAVAVDDRNMTLDRAWSLWRGNRLRILFFLIIGSLILITLWLGSIEAINKINVLLVDFAEIDDIELSFTNPTTAVLFAAIFSLPHLFSVFVLFYAFAATAGALSLSYAGMVRHALQKDRSYHPPKAVLARVSAGIS